MKRRGFTVIEVVIAAAVIGIMAAGIILQLHSFVIRQDLNNAANSLAADLRWMQQTSINEGDNQFYVMAFKFVKPYGYYILLHSKIIKKVTFSQNIKSLNSPQYQFNFGKTGYLSCRVITISLSNDREIRNIIVDSVGRIRIGNTSRQ